MLDGAGIGVLVAVALGLVVGLGMGSIVAVLGAAGRGAGIVGPTGGGSAAGPGRLVEVETD